MGEREIGLSIGDQIADGFEIIAVIPHASRDRIWIMAGQRGDGTYATCTARREPLETLPALSDGVGSFTDLAGALADMLHRARS